MAYIVLDKDNFFYNLDIITQKTKSKDKIALVLKDNAYGHGICEIAKLGSEYGMTKAVVRCRVEAQMIEDFFDEVLILADLPHQPNPKFIYTINSLDAIAKFPQQTRVELKVDTGMRRNGILPHELEEALSLIDSHGLELVGVFSHHGCADELGSRFDAQKKVFEQVKKQVQTLTPSPVRFHSANSAALFRQGELYDEDIARVGIAAYGCLQMPKALSRVELKPVLRLYAAKNSSRVVKSGECVGYGASFQAQEDVVVSNYDFGYGDGFLRACSNNYTTPEGVQIAGRISMDNSSFVSDEEELLIFDDARTVAVCAGTISYEVLTSLKPYISRIIS